MPVVEGAVQARHTSACELHWEVYGWRFAPQPDISFLLPITPDPAREVGVYDDREICTTNYEETVFDRGRAGQ